MWSPRPPRIAINVFQGIVNPMLTSCRSPLSWFVLLLFSVAPGCSSEDGPARYRVSGTVTFRGEPVPVGVIQFTPDSSQGNNGPPGFADIKDGKFDTELSGQGTIGGPHLVMVDAFSGKNISPEANPNGDVLVSAYRKSVTLEAGAETQLDLELTER